MINANRKLDVSIGLSARCQRNYDENKSISEEDLRTLKKCIQHAPSKQNKRLFDAIIVKDKEKIKQLYEATSFWNPHNDASKNLEKTKRKNTNPQVLGDICVVFIRSRDEEVESDSLSKDSNVQSYRHLIKEAKQYGDSNNLSELKAKLKEAKAMVKKRQNARKTDEDRAVGVVAGYLSLTAELLGLKSGCCQCSCDDEIMNILNLTSSDGYINKPLLMMGIGHSDTNKNRREHHIHSDVIFPTFHKKINVSYL
jgi:nitroreductase